MENKRFIVAIDLGTSGVRAFAVGPEGTVQAQRSAALAPARPQEGLSEYEADTLLQTQKRVLDDLLDDIGPQRVLALAVTCQRSTVVLWDKKTARPLAPVLTWEDGRAYAQAQRAEISQEEVHTLTGLYKTPYFSAPKITWCLQNIPAVRQAAQAGTLAAAPVASYLIWHLTNGKTFAADATLAQRMLLWDLHTQNWSDKLCRAFSVPREILPQLKPSVGDYGAYAYKGVSIPIRACMGDQQASVAFMDISPEQACINYGTGAFFLYNTGVQKPVLLPGMLTSVSPSPADGKASFLLEGPVNAAGSVLQWLQAQGIAFDAPETEALCQTARNPVWFFPALGGLGAPYWDFALSPVAAGLSPRTRKADWVAGAVRSIAFLMTDIAAYVQKNGFKILSPLKASGGLSQVQWLLQQQADLLQKEITPLQEAESTVLGAARLAAAGSGVDTRAWRPKTDEKIYPAVSSAESGALYRKWNAFADWCKQNPAR